MIAGAVVLPPTPILLPGVTGRPIREVEDLRVACVAALHALVALVPDRLIVVGAHRAGDPDGVPENGAPISIADFRPPATAGRRCVPSLAVAATLLHDAGIDVGRVDWVVTDAQASPARCAADGERLIAGADRTALVIMGDGSARRRDGSPGQHDERAIGVDEQIEKAMREGDLDQLLALDPEPAEQLMIGGRATWQVLAGALRSLPGAAGAAGAGAEAGADADPDALHRGRRADISYSADPFGVWYVVATFPGQ